MSDQVVFIPQLHTGQFTEHLIIPGFLHRNCIDHHSTAQRHLFQLDLTDGGPFAVGSHTAHVPEYAEFSHHLFSLADHFLLRGMFHGKHFHPAWHMEFHLYQRKFQKDLLQDHGDIFFFQLFAVDRKYGHLVFCELFLCRLPDAVTERSRGIKQDHERFPQLFQFFHCPFFRRLIVCRRDISETAVAGDDDPDGGVIMDHFMSPDLCRLCKRDLFLKPGRLHFPFHLVLQMPCRAVHHIAHAVDQADLHRDLSSHLDLNRFLRNKFGLRGHDRLAARRLGQFVCGALPFVYVFHIRKYQKIHESFDERGFSGPHRADHSYVDLTPCTLFNILIQVKFFLVLN